MAGPGRGNHPLVCYLPEKGLWRLEKTFFWADGGHIICVPKGFMFDRSSIPRLCYPIISKDDLGNTAPLIHDLLYVNQGDLEGFAGKYVTPFKVYTRKDADVLFRKILRKRGVGYFKRWAAYWAVRSPGGWLAWRY